MEGCILSYYTVVKHTLSTDLKICVPMNRKTVARAEKNSKAQQGFTIIQRQRVFHKTGQDKDRHSVESIRRLFLKYVY